MTVLISISLSLVMIVFLGFIFHEEASFWLAKIFKSWRRKDKKQAKNNNRTNQPIKKFCGFRDWSEKGGEICTLFELEDGSEYLVNEEICSQCQIWQQYEAWEKAGKKKDLSVVLSHTMKGSRPLVVETKKLNVGAEKGLSFNDFVIKPKKVPWAGKAAIAFLTLIVYLVFYFAGIFSEPVVRANPDTFYFHADADYAYPSSRNMLTDYPDETDNDFSGCNNTSQTNTEVYCAITPGNHNTTFESSYSGPKKQGWMTADNDLLWGDIASGNWTVYIKYDFNDNNQCPYDLNYIEYKVWKADDNLDNETVINDWTKICDISEGNNNTCNDSFNPGSVSLDSEVLHIEFRQYIKLSKFGCMGAPDDNLDFYCDQGSDERLDTPTYSPVPENNIYLFAFVPFVPLIIKRFKIKDFIKKT